MLAQKGYLGKLSEPQIAQIFADAPRVCRRASPAFASLRVPLPCGKGTGGFATRAYRCGPPLSYGHFPRERGKPGPIVGRWVSRA